MFNGIFMGMIVYFSLVVTKTCLDASPVLTNILLPILISAFPFGAFLGSLWAKLGQRWGMKHLVLRTGVLASVLLFLVPLVSLLPGTAAAIGFTILMASSQLLYSAMKMGQSSLYRCTYPAMSRGRVLGWFVTLSFLTAVPTAYLAGCLVDPHCQPQTHPWLTPLFWLVGENGCQPENFRWLYPLAGCCGLLGCWFYRQLVLLEQPAAAESLSFREGCGRVVQVLQQDKGYFWFQCGYFLSGSAFFLSVHVMVSLCHEEMHFTASQLALALVALPQIMLALSSWWWGRVMDRLGIVQMRVIIATVMTVYLGCYLAGLWGHLAWLIYLGGILRGVAEGGGQVTWSLASVHFAPQTEDVPIYNSIHFTLNGLRGLLMPALGTWLCWHWESWTILVAVLVSAAGIFVNASNTRKPPAEEPLVLSPRPTRTGRPLAWEEANR
jgi:MFS family permease